MYYGRDHALNAGWPLQGYTQTAQKGEVDAARRWFSWVSTPIELWTDSSYVYGGVTNILCTGHHKMQDYLDLWRRSRTYAIHTALRVLHGDLMAICTLLITARV